jgi:hypothetical protein
MGEAAKNALMLLREWRKNPPTQRKPEPMDAPHVPDLAQVQKGETKVPKHANRFTVDASIEASTSQSEDVEVVSPS